MGPDKGVKHVTLQERMSSKSLIHSTSSASMAAILLLEHDLINII